MRSPELLSRLARETGYREDVLDKVLRLLDLLTDVNRHPLLSRALVLKGGTALNFAFGKPRRLSVDLDFNYVGALDREGMERDRPQVEEALVRIARAQGYRLQWSRQEHAGRKCFLQYTGVRGQRDRIEVDLNFLHRQPLLPASERDLWSPEAESTIRTRVVSVEELFAGKVCAMLDRMAPRDLFDVAGMPSHASEVVSSKTFRAVFIALSGTLPHPVHSYGRERGRQVSETEIRQQLYPMLIEGDAPEPEALVNDAWRVVEGLLTLSANEKEFVDRLQVGELRPEMLFSDDPEVAGRMLRHPALLWKARNAATYSGR